MKQIESGNRIDPKIDLGMNESATDWDVPVVGAQAVERAFLLLNVIATQGAGRGMGLSELSKATRLHKSTVHRLASVMVKHRFLRQDPETERYRLGLALAELGNLCLAEMELRREAIPYLKRLMSTVQETVHLGILDEGQVVYIEKVEYESAVRLYSKVGSRMSTHSSALGKAMLAYSTEEQINCVVELGLVAHTPNTITDPHRLRSELLAVRVRGFAVDNEENREGIRCVGAPVFDHNAKPTAAISVSGLASSITNNRVDEIGRLVKDTAEQLSRDLGYRE